MSKRPSQKVRISADANAANRPGLLFILSAPSGAGKSTLCNALQDRFPDLLYSVSYTTRPPRQGERNGVDYHFIANDEFEKGIARGRWAEWAEVHANYYGTSAETLDRELEGGRDILLDIDVQGTRQILIKYPAAITIFILPPSMEVLRERLESRRTEGPANIAVRLKNARKEISQKHLYQHAVVNDRLENTVAELIAIFEKYRS